MTGFAEEPRATYTARMGKAEFFAWLQTKEGGRYELKDGEIVVHAGSTRRHAWLSVHFASALVRRLDPGKWMVLSSDFAVEIGDTIRYPDVVVDPLVINSTDLSTAGPVLTVEILSPSSSDRDMIEKLAEYTSLPSLQVYIVASQDEPIVWVWQRDLDTHEFPAQPAELAGPESVIDIPSLGITLPLADVYRGIAGTP